MKSLLLLCVSVMDAQGGNHLSPHRLGGTPRKKIGWWANPPQGTLKWRVLAKKIFLARISWGANPSQETVKEESGLRTSNSFWTFIPILSYCLNLPEAHVFLNSKEETDLRKIKLTEELVRESGGRG